MNAITLSHLTKHYGTNRGIIDLNLHIDEGDFFGFIGPNGAGKSTTIRVLLGLLQASDGSAAIFGHDVWREHVACMKLVGYLPSEVNFYANQTVADVLRLAAQMHRTDCRQQAAYLCEQLQLDTSRKVSELSFGNRKKVGIVVAMQHCPRLLILDEPTSGLDPLMQQTFFQLVDQYHEQGTTILMSSHILSDVQHHCERTAIIREGRLVACDSVASLLRTKSKKVELRGNIELPSIEGVSRYEREGNNHRFWYDGDIQPLLQTLATQSIDDISITEPSLEDIFMHYYQ